MAIRATRPGGAPNPHPRGRDGAGRPPTFGDFSPEGKALAKETFADRTSNPHSTALASAANAQGRVDAWKAKNPAAEELGANAKNEQKRANTMTRVAAITQDKPGSGSMSKSASRIADNYERTAARTVEGRTGHTNDDLGDSSLSAQDYASTVNSRAGKGTVTPHGSAWYGVHSKELSDIADVNQASRAQTIVAAGTMSPQNSPAQEKRAAGQLASATRKNPAVTLSADAPAAAGTKMGMSPGETKHFNDIAPDSVASMPKQRAHLSGPGVSELITDGLAKGGTEVASGTQVSRGERGQADLGSTGKVTSYVHQSLLAGGIDSLGERGADANDWSEFNRRTHESVPGNHSYFEQDTLFGKDWEADPYGRAHVAEGILNPGHRPAESKMEPSISSSQFYPDSAIANTRSPHVEATTAQDTWQMAQQQNLPRGVEGRNVGNQSQRDGSYRALPASKAMGSDPVTVGYGSGAQYMPTPKGDTKLSSAEAQHAIHNEVNNLAASRLTSRAERRGANMGAGLPAVATQAGSWTGYRGDMGKDNDLHNREESITPTNTSRGQSRAKKPPVQGELL